MLAEINRLKSKKDFKEVALNGRRFFSTFFVVYKLNRKEKRIRVGVVVSNKISKKAVVRNKLRRWVKSDVREVLLGLPAADYMIVVKKAAADKRHYELKKNLINILERNKKYD